MGTDRGPLLSPTQVAALVTELTGAQVRPATIRSYKSRSRMPPLDGADGWYRDTIEAWVSKRPPVVPRSRVTQAQRRIQTASAKPFPVLVEAVRRARAEGLSWTQVAEALPPHPDGRPLTRQAAQSRFGRLLKD